jgi:hypothetical protein
MKRIPLLILVILVVLTVFLNLKNNNPKGPLVILLNKQGIQEAKRLTYRLYLFGMLPIADAVFEYKGQEEYLNKEAYHIKVTARNLDYLSFAVKGSAVLDSYIDVKDGNPFFFRQELKISGKADVIREIRYDQKEHIMYLNGERRKILSDTQDPVSGLFFKIREIDFNKRNDLEININTNQKNYIFVAKADKSYLTARGSKHGVINLSGEVKRQEENNPYHRSKVSMVLATEKKNIPLLIRVFTAGLPVNIRLINIE